MQCHAMVINVVNMLSFYLFSWQLMMWILSEQDLFENASRIFFYPMGMLCACGLLSTCAM